MPRGKNGGLDEDTLDVTQLGQRQDCDCTVFCFIYVEVGVGCSKVAEMYSISTDLVFDGL